MLVTVLSETRLAARRLLSAVNSSDCEDKTTTSRKRAIRCPEEEKTNSVRMQAVYNHDVVKQSIMTCRGPEAWRTEELNFNHARRKMETVFKQRFVLSGGVSIHFNLPLHFPRQIVIPSFCGCEYLYNACITVISNKDYH